MEPNQAAIAFALGEGEHSQLIETDQGFQILRLLRKHPERQKSLEEVRSEIQNELHRQKGKPAAEEFLMRLHRESSIYVAPRYQDEFELLDTSPLPSSKSSEKSVLLENKEIEEVRIVGNRRIPESTIRYYIKSAPGAIFSSRQQRLDSWFLLETGRFSRVDTNVFSGETGVIVVYEVEEQPLVRRIEYSGAPFDRSLTEKDATEWFLAARVGLVVDGPLNLADLSRARNALLQLLYQKGSTWRRWKLRLRPLPHLQSEFYSGFTKVFRAPSLRYPSPYT